jgi:hypothetical protein
MRAVMTTLLAVSAAGALFAISILQAHSQSPGALQEQGFVPRGAKGQVSIVLHKLRQRRPDLSARTGNWRGSTAN